MHLVCFLFLHPFWLIYLIYIEAMLSVQCDSPVREGEGEGEGEGGGGGGGGGEFGVFFGG